MASSLVAALRRSGASGLTHGRPLATFQGATGARLFSSSVSQEEKEEFKQRSTPTKGTVVQEGAEGTRAAAEEAGFERAREDGERVRQAGSVSETIRATGDMVSDAAKGVRQAAEKVADMSREAVGRGQETLKGLYQGGEGGAGGAGSEQGQQASSSGSSSGSRAGAGLGQAASAAKETVTKGAASAADAASRAVGPQDLQDKDDTRVGSYSSPGSTQGKPGGFGP